MTGTAPGLAVIFDMDRMLIDSDPGTRAVLASGARRAQLADLARPGPGMVEPGHVIAPSLLQGALALGLIAAADLA